MTTDNFEQHNIEPVSPEIQVLLDEYVRLFISSKASVQSVHLLPIDGGNSTHDLGRYGITLANESRLSVVVKNAVLTERRVLNHLQTQQHPGIPRSYTHDLTTDAPALICMQDLGDIQHPSSLDHNEESMLLEEVAGLASIHVANWNRASDLPWLPKADRAYFARMIEEVYWRPHWARIVQDPKFYALFAPDLPLIEAAAATIVDDMVAIYDEADNLTLVHTDINPSNVLLLDGHPYFIDWHAAHYGPCYLDIPHHFFTPALAEYYRQALAKQGIDIPQTNFAERFRIAARYTALRYMWWTFEAWSADPANEIWVRHYFSMI